MTAALSAESPAIRWNLSALFSGREDSKIEATWREVHAMSDAFAERYRGKVEGAALDADSMLAALQELESISILGVKPVIYANLLFAADAADPANGAFLQQQMEQGTAVRVKLMFFELELQAAEGAYIEGLLAEPKLADYRHYVGLVRAYSDHRLTEAEEVILEETANTGSRAWQRLFDELTATQTYRFTDPETKETEELSEQEVLDLLRDPNRATRNAAAQSLTDGLVSMQRVLTFIFNNLLQDKRVEDRLRRYEFPEQSRHLSNELKKGTVDLVVDLCREHYGLVSRYYRIKKEILGLSELTHIDRYAPLAEAEERIPWDQARKMILDAFGVFSPTIRDRAEEFFDQEWIDAEPRQGKTGGAFCSFNTPDTHPVIMMTYLGQMDNVQTLAHELGHGVHASLSRGQSYFNYQGTLPMAELASVFAEQIVFERLVSKASAKDRLAMYARKIEDTFATVFRQAAMFRFERTCHHARAEEGELTADRIGEFWQTEMQSMFGDSVKLGEQHRHWWSYVSHFVMSPFYVYAYSFGELLTLSLYDMAKREGPEFEEKYIALLELGGSKSPHELMATVGVDLDSRSFWMGGFHAIENLVQTFEELWTALK
ncbi:MAG: Oligoendopeptidase F, plasmid [Fimbriimonadaceae bacterium]|nr:Oligoendopeptidase F, plasmid [Fimbriimonadaceae bacterium]